MENKKNKEFFKSLNYLKNDKEKAKEIFRYIKYEKKFLNRTTCPCCHNKIDFSVSQKDLDYLEKQAVEYNELYKEKMKPKREKKKQEREKRKEKEKKFILENQEKFKIAVRKRIKPNIKKEHQDFWDWGIELYLDKHKKGIENYEELLFRS